MTTTHGHAILLCMKFLLHDKMAANGKTLILALEEIETIISEPTPNSTKRVTAYGVFASCMFFFLLLNASILKVYSK